MKQLTLNTKQADFSIQYQNLDLRGSAVSLHGQEMIDLIGQFMTAIKQDQVFGQQFSEIKLISSQVRDGKVRTMDFKLSCQYKKWGLKPCKN